MRSSNVKPWGAVVDLAARQEDVLRKEDLVALGYHSRHVRRLVAADRLTQVHPGIYGLGRSLSRRSQFLAAAWWVGEGAALSHESAAAFYGWVEEDPEGWPPIHVSVPLREVSGEPQGPRSRGGVRVHRTRHLDHRDVVPYGLLPVTDRVRTVFDLADHLVYDELRAVADELPSLPVARLAATAERIPGRAGAGRIERLVQSEGAKARYAMERRSVQYFARHGVPEPPGRNVRVHGILVDCAYPGLVVELDSRAHHTRRKEMAQDRRRDRALARHEVWTIRLTWEDLDPDDPRAAADILHRLGRDGR